MIPAYNEAPTLVQTLDRVLAQECVAEVVVVDDGSTDETAALCLDYARSTPRVTIIQHRQNQGKGAAIRTAFAATTSPILIIQDADLELNPDEYGHLVAPIINGESDVVYGSRFMNGTCARTAWWHRLQNLLLTRLSNFLNGQRLTDQATCYKVFRREVLMKMRLQENRFGFCSEVTAKLSRMGVSILEIPISYTPRTRSAGKKLRLRDGFDAVRCVFRYSSSSVDSGRNCQSTDASAGEPAR